MQGNDSYNFEKFLSVNLRELREIIALPACHFWENRLEMSFISGEASTFLAMIFFFVRTL